jgi:hypothetical protein
MVYAYFLQDQVRYIKLDINKQGDLSKALNASSLFGGFEENDKDAEIDCIRIGYFIVHPDADGLSRQRQ